MLDWPYDSGDQGGGTLIPLDDGSFAVGAERDPSRVRFVGEATGG